MKRGLLVLALGIVVSAVAGCSRMTALSNGVVAVDFNNRVSRQAPVLSAFEAVESEKVSADMSSRSGANCAGGVCTIF